ncbi:hypothetical protein A3742_02020 [Oleiphilus sp. HI0071]|uniref:hypothetical protein n=1 Tax=unclassified Oleiphilus TaxID=2631174 RepID=UPI0007C2C81C|nr:MULTISPECIES: hypothetical protein [unclassified Oleiphilus]KZY60981.1 hypothetical protein A3737_05810 [Oleiphilus sp. HI0065]KZY79652.1 hypothetical protein A3742_02020 [Oleiphilus sp. HI0071]KZY93521.1 hypothetical protein A3744_17900 [Oleiphilus sp. HI0073]KZZ40133.1 hypothetical protein A3758_09670 [Oleiphilus sp. HI0118]KZZ51961.1 hypothetical protein A3760_11415 [Oleiphilus sp. HI0122]KZZ72689.1 hypothetical protein A3765_12955 [Oleiphilus sp. HI0130]KZZ78303.1 hypothetical protein
MSVVAVTIAVGSLVCAGIALIVFVQAREKARMERLRLATTLQERYNNIQLILSDMPPQYMDNMLRVILREQSIYAIKELGKVKPSAKHAEYIAEDEQKIQEIKQNSPSFPAIKLDSTEKAREVRVLLQNLYKLLHLWQRKALISPEQAQQYMAHVGFLARQSKADLFSEKARQAANSGKPRVAIHNYHSAIETLKDVANHPEAAKNIQSYREQMASLNKIADRRSEELKQKNQEKIESNEDWDDFLTPQDEWKKKNNYDD